MKQVRKEVKQAKQEARRRKEAEEAGIDSDEEEKQQNLRAVLQFDLTDKIKEGQPLSDSEQEEVDEQILGKDTTQALAEFKARALNKEELADKIRAKKLTHEQLLQFLEDESYEVQTQAEIKLMKFFQNSDTNDDLFMADLLELDEDER